ncbi:hypothetical protein ARSEF4850_006158 [Beauveria asiatica]
MAYNFTLQHISAIVQNKEVDTLQKRFYKLASPSMYCSDIFALTLGQHQFATGSFATTARQGSGLSLGISNLKPPG